MLIKSMELENWGSYRFAKIPFASGVTAILGENGSGKSTIPKGAGWVLFNHLDSKLSDILREGAKSGRVAVSLISSRDGAEYLVEREFTAKTTTRYRVHQVAEANQIVAEGVADVQRWLRSHMGVPPDAHLGTLFENTIGVPQGTFTAPFLLSLRLRKEHFNRLLGTYEYEKASDNLLPTVRQLKDEKVSLDTEIARMEGVLTALPGLRDEGKALDSALLRLGTAKALRKQQVAGLEAKVAAFEEAATQVRQAERQASDAETAVAGQGRLCEASLHATEEAEKAAQVVDENKAGYQAYMQAEKRVQSLTNGLYLRNGVLKRLMVAKSVVAKRTAAIERLPEFQERVERETAYMAEVREEIRKATGLHQQLAELGREVEERREDTDERQQAQAGLLANIVAMNEQQAFLLDDAVVSCPTCGSALTAAHRDELLARNGKTLQEWSVARENLLAHIQRQLDLIATLQQRQGETQDALRKLATARDLVRVQKNVKARQDELAALQEDIAGATGEADVVAGLEEEYAGFGDLDTKLAHFQGVCGGRRQAHDLYVAHTQLALLYPERQAKLDELLAKCKELKHECNRLAKEYWQAKAAYDSEEHTKVQAEATRLQAELAGVQAQLKEKRYRLTVVQESIERLEATEKEQIAKAAKAAELHQLQTTIETVRDILREAGPYVTRRLVRQISQRAAAILRDLTGDPGGRLQWTEDYEAFVEHRGYSRTFAKHSGGERMRIALAVRLAMLQELSAIDVAFFDEPTDSLSKISCENLADTLSEIKGLSQLFIISHDSTFESAAENTIRIVQDERGSHLAA